MGGAARWPAAAGLLHGGVACRLDGGAAVVVAVGEESRRAELTVQGAPCDSDVGLADVGAAQLFPAGAELGRFGGGDVGGWA